MAQPLPRRIQLKLEQTLSQWHQWRCTPPLTRAPDVVKTLSAGIGNFSVLVESGQQFVVRIDGLNPAANGLSRQAEWRALAEAHRAGLAPRPRYFNPELGSLVCDFLPPDKDQDGGMIDVALLLRAIHQLPARHHRLDLSERVLRYEKLLEHRGEPLGFEVMRCRQEMTTLLQEAQRFPMRAVLCHNDLLRANRLYSAGRLWALDWEYCAMGHPLYDLAVVAHGDSLDIDESNALLHAYLDRGPDASEREALHVYGCIYRYLELLWYLALDRPAIEASVIEEKLSDLKGILELSRNAH